MDIKIISKFNRILENSNIAINLIILNNKNTLERQTISIRK